MPPGNPNRLKMMPRGIGSTSTPEDFLSGIFAILIFRIFYLAVIFSKAKACSNGGSGATDLPAGCARLAIRVCGARGPWDHQEASFGLPAFFSPKSDPLFC